MHFHVCTDLNVYKKHVNLQCFSFQFFSVTFELLSKTGQCSNLQYFKRDHKTNL